MKFVKIDPPGTFCTYEALRDVVKKTKPQSFIEIGCGGGDFSKLLCSLGMTGTGVDFSRAAIEISNQTLRKEIEVGKYTLIEADIAALDADVSGFDLGISVMVMEHIEDDVGFVDALCKLVRPGGCVAICVQGRRDLWSFEDETVGHFRRYDRDDLRRVLLGGGLRDIEIWSVAVPVANFLHHIGNWLLQRSGEAKKTELTRREQTETSGLREIRWKTIFPPWAKVILNRYTLYPLFAFQRLFYGSNLGVIMLGFGRVPK